METKAFRKACFDLVTECDDVRATDPDVISKLVKEDDDGLWIRFTAIGSLLDYCNNNETGSVLAYWLKALAISLIIDGLVKRDHK